MSRVFDISLPVHPGMLTWPGDPPVTLEETSRMARGDHANVSRLTLGTHTGTHVDPPFHFIDGAPTVDQLPLDALAGPAFVADLRDAAGEVGPAALAAAGIPDGAERVLLRTPNSELWAQPSPAFPDEYVSLSVEGARWFVERGVRLVGTDFLSIEKRGAPGHPTHVALLSAGVVIVEGLDLRAIEPGAYRLAVLPLRVAGGDGAPARALLMSE